MRGCQGGVFKVLMNYHTLVFFNRLGPFPHVLGQVKEWLISQLHEIIRAPHVRACPMDFNLLCH